MQAEAADLARRATELQEQLGGPHEWRQARQQAERAEASYERDRERAHHADQRDLTVLRDRTTSHDTAAIDAGTPRDEFLAEQQLQTTMPEGQRSLEHQLRSLVTQQQLDQTAPERQLERSLHADLDYHRVPSSSTSIAISTQGAPSLGR